MSHSNGKITAPINLAGDVYATLGIGPTSDLVQTPTGK